MEQITEKMEPTNNPILEMKNSLSQESNNNQIDPTLFDVDTPISTPIFYERLEYKRIAETVLSFLDLNHRKHCVLVGGRGTGKTSVVNYILDEALSISPDSFDKIYLNCSKIKNSYQIARALIKSRTSLSTLLTFQEFTDKFKNQNKKLILVLDELGPLEEDQLFYKITREPELKHIQLIMISKTNQFFESLSLDTQSSMKQEFVFFDSYEPANLQELLLKRAKAGLREYHNGIIQLIVAAMVKGEYNDTRVAIKLLGHFHKDKSYISMIGNNSNEVLNLVFSMAESEFLKYKKESIRSLTDIHLSILYAITQKPMSNEAFVFINSRISLPISKTHFFHQIDYLVNMDLIKPVVRDKKIHNIIFFKESIGQQNIEFLEKIVKERGLIYEE